LLAKMEQSDTKTKDYQKDAITTTESLDNEDIESTSKHFYFEPQFLSDITILYRDSVFHLHKFQLVKESDYFGTILEKNLTVNEIALLPIENRLAFYDNSKKEISAVQLYRFFLLMYQPEKLSQNSFFVKGKLPIPVLMSLADYLHVKSLNLRMQSLFLLSTYNAFSRLWFLRAAHDFKWIAEEKSLIQSLSDKLKYILYDTVESMVLERWNQLPWDIRERLYFNALGVKESNEVKTQKKKVFDNSIVSKRKEEENRPNTDKKMSTAIVFEPIELHDLSVIYDDVEFKVHKFPLAQTSLYFRNLLKTNPKTVEIEKITCALDSYYNYGAFKYFLDWCYWREFRYFNIDAIELLDRNFDATNFREATHAIEMYSLFSDRFEMKELKKNLITCLEDLIAEIDTLHSCSYHQNYLYCFRLVRLLEINDPNNTVGIDSCVTFLVQMLNDAKFIDFKEDWESISISSKEKMLKQSIE
jgi:hypothetical protein